MPPAAANILAATGLIMALTASLQAQEAPETIDELIALVNAEAHALSEQFHFDNARPTLRAAFDAGGVEWSARYTGSWGGFIAVDWSHATRFYSTAARNLNAWNLAVRSGDVTQEDAVALLLSRLPAFQALDQAIDDGFADELRVRVLAGRAYDRAHDIGCCSDGYSFHRAQAAAAFASLRAPDWSAVGRLSVFPTPTAPEADPDADARDAVIAAVERVTVDLPPDELSQSLRDLVLFLTAQGMAPDAAILQALSLEAERFDLLSRDFSGLLERVGVTSDPELRRERLQIAAELALEQAGYHLPPYLADILNDGAASNQDVADILDSLGGLSRLHDLLTRDGGLSSVPSRAFSGLRAALELADRNGQPLVADELREIIQNGATAAGGGQIVTGPYQLHFGAVAGQVGQAAEGWSHVSAALDGVSDAIAGDPSGIDRALAAARRTEEALSARSFGQAMVEGALDGADRIIPGSGNVLRGLFGSLVG